MNFFAMRDSWHVQRLLLVLLLRITPVGTQGTIWNVGNLTRVSCMYVKCPTHCTIDPAFSSMKLLVSLCFWFCYWGWAHLIILRSYSCPDSIVNIIIIAIINLWITPTLLYSELILGLIYAQESLFKWLI